MMSIVIAIGQLLQQLGIAIIAGFVSLVIGAIILLLTS